MIVVALSRTRARLAEMGHRNLLVTHTLADRACLTRSVRRGSGVVLTPKWRVEAPARMARHIATYGE